MNKEIAPLRSQGSWKNHDLHSAFLRDVSRYQIPTKKETIAYGWIIQNAIRRILKVPRGKKICFYKVDYPEIIGRMNKRERKTFNLMLLRNLRLVLSVANKFYNCGSMTEHDLVSFGIEGMTIAALRYDPKRGFRFSTYASWWIRHHIQRAIQDHSCAVRLPVHMFDKLRNIKKAQKRATALLGRDPTLSETAHEAGMNQRDLEKCLSSRVAILSLDSFIVMDDTGTAQFRDLIADETFSSPEEYIVSKLDIERLHLVMGKVLDEREFAVIFLRYWNELTLNKTAVHPVMIALQRSNRALSRERARQIQEQALAKLRHAFTR